MIRPATLDITVHQRATYRQQIRLKADDDPLDATGYEIVAEVWDQYRNNKYADFDIEWLNQAEGLFDLVLTHEQTELIDQDAYWDMLVIEPSGDRYFWLEGKVIWDIGYSEKDDP